MEARLSSVAILMVGAGVVVGARLAARRGEWRDLPAAAFAGAAHRTAGRRRWLRCHPERRTRAGFLVELVLGRRAPVGSDRRLPGLDIDSLDPAPVERSGDRAMIARWRSLVWSTLGLLVDDGAGAWPTGCRRPTEEIARAIARGVEFLKDAQDPDGSWNDPEQRRTGWASRRWRAWRYWKTAWPVMPRRSTRLAQSSQRSQGSRTRPMTWCWRSSSWHVRSKGAEARPMR